MSALRRPAIYRNLFGPLGAPGWWAGFFEYEVGDLDLVELRCLLFKSPSTARSCRTRQHRAGSETGAPVGGGPLVSDFASVPGVFSNAPDSICSPELLENQ